MVLSLVSMLYAVFIVKANEEQNFHIIIKRLFIKGIVKQLVSRYYFL